MPRTAKDALLILIGDAIVFAAAYALSSVKPPLVAAIVFGAIAAAITTPILRYVQRHDRK
jgi:predicted PurR-regulated permease PerM